MQDTAPDASAKQHGCDGRMGFKEKTTEGIILKTITGPFADTRDTSEVHRMFRRKFGLLLALVREVAAGDEERSRIVADHVDFLWTILARGSREVASIVQLMVGHHEPSDGLVGELEDLPRRSPG